MSDIWISCGCGDPECLGYRLDDLGRHPFFVPFDRHKFDGTVVEAEQEKKASLPFGIMATSSWEFDGERTDLNDLIAALWGAYLRSAGIANVALLSERGFAIASEVSSRAVIPVDWGSEYINWADEEQKLLLAKTSIHMQRFMHEAFYAVASGERLKKRDTFDEPPWLSRIQEIFGIGERSSYELQTRQTPQWTCLTVIDKGLTVAEISSQSADRLRSLLGQNQLEIHLSGHAMAIKDARLTNAVERETVHQLLEALSILDEREAQDALILPMASHVLGIGRRSVVSIAAECGRSAFNKELQRSSERRKTENAFFLTNVKCIWADEIHDRRFEEMIGELLKLERGVTRVRQVGSTREADDGRDFIAEWISPQASSTLDTKIEISEAMLSEIVDVIVQVKVRSKGVGRSDLSGIRDTIEHHECGGMLFVAFPNVTTTLNDHLHKLRKQKKWWIDWWNKADIEDRLRRNATVADRYPDLVRLVGT